MATDYEDYDAEPAVSMMDLVFVGVNSRVIAMHRDTVNQQVTIGELLPLISLSQVKLIHHSSR